MKFQNELLIIVTIAVMTFTPLAVKAGVFKCEGNNSKIIYQPQPCTKGVSKSVEIKQRSAEKDAEEAAKLQIWENNNAVREATEKEALRINQEKEQEYRMHEAEVNAANEQVNAQINSQANAQANQDNLLNKINKKLNRISTQQMLNNNEQQMNSDRQQLYNINHP